MSSSVVQCERAFACVIFYSSIHREERLVGGRDEGGGKGEVMTIVIVELS